MSIVDTAEPAPDGENAWATEGSGLLPRVPPLTEADVDAFVTRIESFPTGKPVDLPRWPFGVRCQGACGCHCNHSNCACQEGTA